MKSQAVMWCLRGLLPRRQEDTLWKLFDVIKKITLEEYDESHLETLMTDTSEAIALLERDFPIALQVRN